MYATSTVSSLLALAPFALAHYSAPAPPTTTGTSYAKNFDITVGLGGLKFTPDRIRASKGDTLTFTYFPKAHTVTTSSFAAPCVPLNGTVGQKINSGFVPVDDKLNVTGGAQQFVVTVQDDKAPLWIYCAQTKGNHCQNGMNMVVNEPADPAKSLDAYRIAAAKTNISIAAAVVEGGVFQPNKKAVTLPPYPTSTAQAPSQTYASGSNDGKKDSGDYKSGSDYNSGKQGGDYSSKDGSKSGDYNNNDGDKKTEYCTPPPASYQGGSNAYIRARSLVSAETIDNAIEAAIASALADQGHKQATDGALAAGIA